MHSRRSSGVDRWQMALFLTRLLAADGIPAPAGLRVSVTPTDTVTSAAGTARTYTATFKNADGTPYTGGVGILLRIVSSAGVIDWDGAAVVGTTCPDNTTFEAPTDSLVAGPAGPTCGPSLRGFPGADGVVSFTVRHAGAAERVVPVAWEDLDGDGLPEIVGNAAPTEPFGVGGQANFTAAALLKLPAASLPVVLSRWSTRPAIASKSVQLSYFYDSNDLFRIEGVATDLAGFEAALNVGDLVNGTYAADAVNQSTFDINTDNDPALTVTEPAAAVDRRRQLRLPSAARLLPDIRCRIYRRHERRRQLRCRRARDGGSHRRGRRHLECNGSVDSGGSEQLHRHTAERRCSAARRWIPESMFRRSPKAPALQRRFQAQRQSTAVCWYPRRRVTRSRSTSTRT